MAIELKNTIIQYLVIPIIVGIVLLIGSGIVLPFLMQKTPQLTYSNPGTTPFSGENKNIAIYSVQIQNSGSVPIEDVNAVITFKDPIIESVTTSIDPSIKYSAENTRNIYKVEIPLLNQNENAAFLIYAISNQTLPSKPEISLRGKGVAGELYKFKTVGLLDLLIGIIPFILVLTIVASILTTVVGSRLRLIGQSESHYFHKMDISDFFLILCRKYNLSDDVTYYLNLSRKASFWVESDRMYQCSKKAINPSEIEIRKNILINLLKLIPNQYITNISQAIIKYNIGKISKLQGLNSDYERYLNEAKSINSKIIEVLLKIED